MLLSTGITVLPTGGISLKKPGAETAKPFLKKPPPNETGITSNMHGANTSGAPSTGIAAHPSGGFSHNSGIDMIPSLADTEALSSETINDDDAVSGVPPPPGDGLQRGATILVTEKGGRTIELLSDRVTLRFTNYQKNPFDLRVGADQTLDHSTVELVDTGRLQYMNRKTGKVTVAKVPLGAKDDKFWCVCCGGLSACAHDHFISEN